MRLIATLLISLLSSLSNVAHAKDSYSIDLKVTGLNKTQEATAIIQVSFDKDFAPKTVSITEKERNNNGHFSKVVDTDIEKDTAKTIYIFGSITSKDGKPIGFIPLHEINIQSFNHRLYLKKDLKTYSNKRISLLNSFPFSKGFHKGFINTNNLESVLKATKILIENKYIEDKKSWEYVFNAYQTNISFFKKDNTKIRLILEFLRVYGKILDQADFFEFYISVLLKLDKLGIDGSTDEETGEELGKRLYSEYNTLITKEPRSVSSYFGKILRQLRDETRYPECIKLSNSIFNSIISDGTLIDEFSTNKEFRRSVLSSMQASTECLQLEYAKEAPSGNKHYRDGAAEYHKNKESANATLSSFTELYERLIEKSPQIFSRKSGVSRVKEITKYYNSFAGVL